MGNIKWVPDLGAPLAVVAVDMVMENVAPTWTKWADGIMTAGGYLAAGMGWGGDFMKNIGIASMPITARNIYDYVRGGGGGGTTRRLSYRPVSTPRVAGQVSRIPVTPFEEMGLY